MYFNENKGNTNIDNEFKGNERFSFENLNLRKMLLIGAGILILIIIIIIIIALLKGNKHYFVTLEGEENITIYQGVTYNEPGYSGYDNRNNDLTNLVEVKSNLDAESVGTYTIIYKLYNTSATRTISVVEKPDVVTVIHLSGDKNMTIKANSTFTDPGYTAIDAIDGDLTDQVKTTGKVDTAKKGTYKIVYSVVNSKGVTTTEARTVTVE